MHSGLHQDLQDHVASAHYRLCAIVRTKCVAQTPSVTPSTRKAASALRAASNLIVGDTVQAKSDGKWLYFVMPGTGKTIKAKIMRQERI